MKMSFRWYGTGNDSITLSQIRQIPGVTEIVWALHHKQPGEVWEKAEIQAVKDELDSYGFGMSVVESVNVHDDIKTAGKNRDLYIENYKQTLRNLKEFGVKVVCYNFMPVFDWTRTDLFHPLPDGSTALYYEKSKIKQDPAEMAEYILKETKGYTMPGWEPERLANLKQLFELYKDVDKETLWANLKYFLEALMPVCHECDIKMAIHPDDPPWDIFGLPRLITDEAAVERFLKMVDDPYNCLTLCSGSLGSNPENNVADIVRKHCDRIAFAHIRNVKHFENGDFSETSHRDCDGDVGILDIIKAYHDGGFDGYIRPDHGRHIWDEKCRPGYGLYDRALGIMYILGAWEMLEKQSSTDNK
ncbi:mannonate dehydratase [uncultured Ruminococcus sp.]|uniref:mannonate dehydratase n=1 Tax=uncultured Ruminococcus sp. TaxID=165186 RepID=UPI0025DEAE7C|nr:mannonate dehydratase [uncultured Ruminococcus sp.]